MANSSALTIPAGFSLSILDGFDLSKRDDLSPIVIRLNAAFIALVSLVVSLRVFVRLSMVRALGVDDDPLYLPNLLLYLDIAYRSQHHSLLSTPFPTPDLPPLYEGDSLYRRRNVDLFHVHDDNPMYTGQGSGGILADGEKMCQDEGLLLRCRGCRYHYRYPTLYATAAAAVEAEDFSEGESDCFHSVWARNFLKDLGASHPGSVTTSIPSAGTNPASEEKGSSTTVPKTSESEQGSSVDDLV
ncbi:MAG: hypothetical protein Q9187_001553 [Circinaria calcarea]